MLVVAYDALVDGWAVYSDGDPIAWYRTWQDARAMVRMLEEERRSAA